MQLLGHQPRSISQACGFDPSLPLDDATLASSGTDVVKHGSSVVDSPIPNQDQSLPLAVRGMPL